MIADSVSQHISISTFLKIVFIFKRILDLSKIRSKITMKKREEWKCPNFEDSMVHS